MPSLFRTILLMLFTLCVKISIAFQPQDTLAKLPPKEVEKLAAHTIEMAQKFDADFDKALQKRLHKVEQAESKLLGHLQKTDSLKAKLFAADLQAKTQQWTALLQAPDSILAKYTQGPYLARIDSLTSLLGFSTDGLTGGLGEAAKTQIAALRSRLAIAGEVDAWLQSRGGEWSSYLQSGTQVSQQLTQAFGAWKSEAAAWKHQLTDWKETLNQPEKLEREALRQLQKLPAFKAFMQKHGELARLFGPVGGADMGGGGGVPLPGLQTRASLTQALTERFGANALQSGGAIQQQIQSGMQQVADMQNQLMGLANNALNSGTGTELTPKQAEAAQLKSKTFKERIELGWNLQTDTRIGQFPAINDLGLSAGYKINPRSVVGVGVAYKFGLGEGFRKLNFTHEGIGLRSFLDWRMAKAGSKAFKNLWLTAGFEMNYFQRIANDVQWKDLAWQKSGLVGLSKVMKFKKKEGKMQVLFDFLNGQTGTSGKYLLLRFGWQL